MDTLLRPLVTLFGKRMLELMGDREDVEEEREPQVALTRREGILLYHFLAWMRRVEAQMEPSREAV